MKKLPIAILCMLLVGLCACGSNKTNTPSATATAPTTAISKETTVTSSIPELITDKDDPYAGVVKERYNVLFDKNVSTIVRHYIYYDIDGNGIEELLLGAETHYGIVINSVYTIKDGVTVKQEALLGWMWEFDAERFLFKNGTIRLHGIDGARRGYAYYHFEAGELEFRMGLGVEHGEYACTYPEDMQTRVPITKEEFDRIQKEMEGDGQVVELDWKPLAEYGR